MEEAQGQTGGIIPALAYGFFSISLIITNKVVVSSYLFKFPFALTLGQMIATLIFVGSYKVFVKKERLSISKEDLKMVWPLSVAFVGNAILGFVSIRVVSVPMYTALRRFTTAFVMASEVVMLGRTYESNIIASVALMVLGAIVAAVGDLNFDASGYAWVFLNNAFTASYLVLVKKLNSHSKKTYDIFTLLLLNNAISVLPMFFLIPATGELDKLYSFEYWTEVGFVVSLSLSLVQAFFLNYSIYWCTTANSPLTTSITGQLTKIVTTVAGYLFFADAIPEATNIIGQVIGFAGSIYYSYIGYMNQSKQ